MSKKTKQRTAPPGFGLIIIGTEILDGRQKDSHFANACRLLRERNLDLKYTLILPDDPSLIDIKLRWAMSRPEPFFCCGGIGATPDDYTRHCAARATGLPLEHHPQGLAILKKRFGEGATSARLNMVEFPKGSVLIPNPVNQVPGFQIRNGHFLPGFPEMAFPMMRWVLDAWYGPGKERASRTVVLPGAREADLVNLMEAFIAAHSGISFSSLPRFTDSGTELRLGLAGSPEDVENGLRDLTRELDKAGVRFRADPAV